MDKKKNMYDNEHKTNHEQPLENSRVNPADMTDAKSSNLEETKSEELSADEVKSDSPLKEESEPVKSDGTDKALLSETGEQGEAERSKKKLSGNRLKHGGMSAIMTAVFLVLVVLLNVLVGMLSDRFPSMNMDLTAKKLNTLSQNALEAAKSVENDTEIIILATEEEATRSTFATLVDYAQVVNLAKSMAEVNPKISVSFKDLDQNPSLATEYANENLSKGAVILKTVLRYRVLAMDGDLFTYQQDSSTGETTFYSMADGSLANAINSVNMAETVKASFAAGHNEYLSASVRVSFENMLKDRYFETEEFNMLTGEIPEGTQILIIPGPTTDYTETEIDKLRAFLSDDGSGKSKTVLYIPYPSMEVPVLSAFLEEWGISIENSLMVESDSSKLVSSDPSVILVSSAGEYLLENSYSLLISPVSPPISILFDNNDGISVYKLWNTFDTAFPLTSEADFENPATAVAAVATLSQKKVGDEASANLAVFSSASAFSDTFFGSTAFDNSRYISDLLTTLTGVEASASYVQPVATSGIDISASQKTMSALGMGVFTLAIPLAILVIGLVVFLRRRNK